MVRKSKRKQAVIPFERSNDAVYIDLTKCDHLLTSDESDTDNYTLSNVLRSLKECGSILQQTKVLQENKTYFKSILGKTGESEYPSNEKTKKTICILLHIYLEPSYFPLRKSLEWLGEAICRSTALCPLVLRSTVKTMSLQVLNRSIDSGELVQGELTHCLHWVFSFSSLVLLDKELSWLDDSILDPKTGVWSSEVWPATSHLGNGSLLSLLQAMALVLQRCTTGLVSQETSASSSISTGDALRYSECVGECMRVLSAVLKSRRKASIPPVSLLHETFASTEREDDMWGTTCAKIIKYGCQLLSCESCNKDILTQAALSVVSVQWLLRERLWSTASGRIDTPHPYSGYQLVAIITLLNLSRYFSSLPVTVFGDGPSQGEAYASAVGVHKLFADALLAHSGGVTMLARVALLRACISVFDSTSLMWPNDFQQKSKVHLIAGKYACSWAEMTEEIDDETTISPGLLLGPIISLVTGFMQSTDPLVQVYGLQTLETWLGRVEVDGIGKDDKSNVSGLLLNEGTLVRTFLLKKLYHVSQLLCRSWSHPHKLISHVVPAVFQRLIDLFANIESSMTSKDAINTPDYEDIWCEVLTQTLKLPPEHRGRYQALSALLPKVGARRFLNVQPDIIRSLVMSMRIRDVSSSVSQFMGSFLTAIKVNKNMDLQKMRNMYTHDVVGVLCSSEKRLRLNGNDYLLQELMKLDPDGCGPSLINAIRGLGNIAPEHRLWGLISVALQARLLSRHGGEIDFGPNAETATPSMREKSRSRRGDADKDDVVVKAPAAMKYISLLASEVRQACLSDDVNLRLAGLTLLVASQRTVAPLHPFEMDILQETLPYSLKSHVADHRQRVLRVLRLLVTRLFETHRAKVKEITKSIEHRRKTQANAQPLHIPAGEVLQHVTEDESENACIVQDIHHRVKWLNGLIVTNLYPESPNEKQIMALEMLKCIIDGLSNGTNNHSNKSQLVSSKGLKGSCHPQKTTSVVTGTSPYSVTCDDSLIHFFFTEAITTCLLNLLLSSWDRTRSLASEIMLKLLPTPWPGYDDQKLQKAVQFSGSIASSSSSSYKSGGVSSRMASLEDDDDEVSKECSSASVVSIAAKSHMKVINLFRLGCDLVGSPRHRNADNGALLLRVVMNVYSLQLRWVLQAPTIEQQSQTSDLVHSLIFVAPAASVLVNTPEKDHLASGKEESRIFVDTLSRILEQRLVILHDAFRSLFGQESTTTTGASKASGTDTDVNVHSTGSKPISIFSHGVVLALRYCIEDINSAGVFTDLFNKENHTPDKELQIQKWIATIQQVLRLCLRALQIAMLVVAEAPADTYFAPMPNADKEKEFMLVIDSDKKMKNLAKNTSSENKELRGYASDSFMMNTNIFMDIDDDAAGGGGAEGGLGGDGNASNGQHIQHAVVGAWLLVKESCALLAKLVQISLVTTNDKIKPPTPSPLIELSTTENVLLQTENIAEIGGVILDALSRLKHNGAIAEAQVALQSVCESVLRHNAGDSAAGNVLSQLPKTWIETLFAKLRGEQKASILRRSAGFAFSFLSLLRSEPKNCRPVLLPLAMDKLFFHAVNGNGVDGLISTSDEDKWRAIVHALNIIRLIILDATLGPDLYPYIAEATKIAVRGFKSDRWAVRNSSMMVFSAVVQRAVDNDKKENGGARAATPEEFFGRFPSLYPFFVIALSDIVQRPLLMDTQLDWPMAVGESRCSMSALKNNVLYDGSMAVHPSLYPILLMLSKMKTTTDTNITCVVGQGEMTKTELHYLFDKSPAAINVSLFIPLVEECCDQQLYHVRVMAAKALASLIPLSDVPNKVTAIMKEFRGMFCSMYDNHTPTKAPTRQQPLSSNLLHGMLLQVLELLSNTRKLVCGSSSELGDNKTFLTTLFTTLQNQLVPELFNFLDTMRVIIVKFGGKSDFLEIEFPPAILLAVTRIFRVVNDILNTKTTKQVLESLCSICFSDLLEVSECHNQPVSLGKRSQYALETSRIPFNPLLWKECITDLVQFSGEHVINELLKVLSTDEKNPTLSTSTLEAMGAFYVFKQFLEFPISEVREGVLTGCFKILKYLAELVKTHTVLSSQKKKHFLFNHLFVCYHSVETGRQTSHAEDEVGLLNQLLRRFLQETEPPILEANLELLEEMSRVMPFVNVSNVTTQEAFTDAIPQLLQVVCGSYRPDTLLDFMDPTVRTAYTSNEQDDERNMPMAIAPTMSAAYALNLLGWVIGGFFNPALVVVDSLEEKLAAAATSSDAEKNISTEKVMFNFFYKYANTEGNLSQIFGSLGEESDVHCSLPPSHTDDMYSPSTHSTASISTPASTPSSEHVWSWLRLLEMSVGEGPDSDGEIAGLDARLSAAQTLLTAGALKWAVLQSSFTLKQVTTSMAAGREVLLAGGGGDFTTRLWLVALRLLQDDDVDVRYFANNAVSEANCLCAHLLQDLVSYPSLFPPPELTLSSLSSVSISKQGRQGAKVTQNNSSLTGAIATVEGRTIEGLATSLSIALAWKVLSDVKKMKTISTETNDILDKWLNLCRLPEESESQSVEKIFEVDDNNEYEEGVVTASTIASALAGAVLLLIPASPTTSLLWNSLFTKATATMDFLRQDLRAAPVSEGISPPRKYIGSTSFEGEGFERLYCGLSGAAQLVMRLNIRCDRGSSESDRLFPSNSPFVTALMTLRQDALTLLSSMHRSEQTIHPLLIGQVQQIASADVSQLILSDHAVTNSAAGVDWSSQRGNRLASSYGNKKGVVL